MVRFMFYVEAYYTTYYLHTTAALIEIEGGQNADLYILPIKTPIRKLRRIASAQMRITLSR